jgi:hypothetical protein
MPFIMVAYLLITSIFASSFAGLMVLVGLLLTTGITIMVSRFIPTTQNPSDTILTFEGWNISNLPLSTHTFAYMLGYFVYVIVKNDMVSSNLLLIIALSAILCGDLVYQLANSNNYAIIPAIIGLLLGSLWATMLPKTAQMVPQSYEQSKCNVKKGIYRCRIRRTGEIV